MNRDPRQKKRLTLKRDRRYAHGNSPHARNLSRSKRKQEHRFRQRLRRALSVSTDTRDAASEATGSRLHSVQRPRWAKTTDISLEAKFKRREIRILEKEVWMRRALDPPLDVRLARRLKGQGLHRVAVEKISQQVRRMTGLGQILNYRLDAPGVEGYDLPLLRLLNRLLRHIPVNAPKTKGQR